MVDENPEITDVIEEEVKDDTSETKDIETIIDDDYEATIEYINKKTDEEFNF